MSSASVVTRLYGKCLTGNDLGNPGGPNMNCEGFVTSTSWGYRTRLVFEYSKRIYGLET